MLRLLTKVLSLPSVKRFAPGHAADLWHQPKAACVHPHPTRHGCWSSPGLCPCTQGLSSTEKTVSRENPEIPFQPEDSGASPLLSTASERCLSGSAAVKGLPRASQVCQPRVEGWGGPEVVDPPGPSSRWIPGGSGVTQARYAPSFLRGWLVLGIGAQEIHRPSLLPSVLLAAVETRHQHNNAVARTACHLPGGGGPMSPEQV